MDKFRKKFLAHQEKVDKKKARRYSLLMLLILLLAIWLPFITQNVQAEKEINRAILVTFEEEVEVFKDKSSSERSSSRPAPAAETETPEEPIQEPTPDPEPVPPPVEQIPERREVIEPIRTLDVPQRNVTLTSPSREIAFAPMLQDLSSTAQVEDISEEVMEVTEEVSEDVMKEFAEYFKKNSAGRTSGAKSESDNGQSSDSGEGDSGKSDTGDSKSDGAGDSGDEGFEFDGDGLLTRKVIHRANLNNIIKQTGKIVVNLCVNQDGKVIFAKADKAKSTLKETGLLRLAELAAEKYRYERDYTVADTQCGKLTFVVKIED